MDAARDRSSREEQVRELVAFLCSRECAGRKPGSKQSARARERILAELEACAEPAGEEGYLQVIPGAGTNVLGRIPGKGPLAERAILVAAHYDHLGKTLFGKAYWGADDNAAAVAILLDVARGLSRDADGRQVILAAFDCEEPPHFTNHTMGSIHYVAHPPTVPVDHIDLMVCMDLVGHAVGAADFPEQVRQSLFVLGAELSAGTPALVDAVAARAEGVVPRRLGLDVIPPLSDYYAFVEAGIPALFLTCGRWEHYHQVTDTPEKLDYPKIVASADFLLELVEALRARPEVPVPFLRDGRDDAATVASLRAIGEQLAPLVPQVQQAAPLLEMLAASAARGDLSLEERGLLTTLIHGLENVLA